MKIAIQMDAPASLKAATDSSIALAQEAQRRGHSLCWYHPTQLSWSAGEVRARVQSLRCTDDAASWCELGEAHDISLAEMDVVLMRQDPPFDMAYLSATYLLERLPAATRVINNPAYVRNHPEKLAIMAYPDAIPPTLVSADTQTILAFAQQQGSVVVKPLYGFGGHSIYKFDAEDGNLLTLLEQHQQRSQEPLMVQAFLPEVKDRDVRVLLVNGGISAAFGRVPAAQSIRANMRVGGKAVPTELNDVQRAIAERVAVQLKAGGVLLAGLDLIGDYLTEINITSPTGIRAAQLLCPDSNPAAEFWDAAEG